MLIYLFFWFSLLFYFLFICLFVFFKVDFAAFSNVNAVFWGEPLGH